MKSRAMGLAVLTALCLAMPAVAQVQKELFSDTFPGPGRDNTKWRNSAYLFSNARLQVTDGKVLFTRNTNSVNPFQQVQWDARFVRVYDNADFLQIGATVRIPHKIKTGEAYYSLGIGMVSDGANFIELAVEDNADGRFFTVYIEDTNTVFNDTFVFDAPQNVTIFDLVIVYSAAKDSMGFYWSIPGVQKLFRIGRILKFSTVFGGTTPRKIQPYIIGLMHENALMPASWNVFIDNFTAYRENAL